ncbi:unnamed protein product, partial [Nippostrongylus brasiliensis]|uniref:Peptidase A2 domain-containing protein n=1 Tax=Nippostrongylus brasiliensis TaxID=27835 RepID=A0A0N4Y5U2_NIPBR
MACDALNDSYVLGGCERVLATRDSEAVGLRTSAPVIVQRHEDRFRLPRAEDSHLLTVTHVEAADISLGNVPHLDLDGPHPQREEVLSSDRRGDRPSARTSVVNSASVPLRDTQAALDQANARVAALLERNEELSRQAFGPTHSVVGSRASSLPINPVFFCMLSVLLCAPLVYSQPAWLCPTDPQDPFLQIPLPFNCSQLVPRVTSPPQNTSIHLYRPNTKTYNSPAVLCKIVDSSVTYSVNFFGARSEAHSESSRTVTIEHCRQMQQHARCEYGSLVRSGSVSKTSHTLDFTWPSAPFGCCTEYTLTVTNCFLISTMVHGRHGSSSPDSPVGDTRHCVYKDGSCVLRDGSVLLWSPDTEETCQFVFVSKLKGQQMDSVWLSSSGEFALSWSASNPAVVDCGHSLIISDQGYALSIVQRSPRAAPAAAAVGLVTSNQLAAQLLAVEDAAQTVLPEGSVPRVDAPSGDVPALPSTSLTIFHNLVLTNVSELVPDQRLGELWETRSHERLLDSLTHGTSASASHTTTTTSSNFLPTWVSLLPGTPFQWWTTVCCLYVSAKLLGAIAGFYVRLNYPGAARLLRAWRRHRESSTHQEDVATSPPHIVSRSFSPRASANLQLTRLELDSSSTWPPKASVSPVVVNSFLCSGDYFVAQIPVKVNQVRMLALVDTGAAISLTSGDLAPLLGCFSLQPSPIQCAIGVAGIPVRILGSAFVQFQIGIHTIRHPIYFTQLQSVPTAATSYNVILGNDLLRRLPSWNIDYSARTFNVGDTAIGITSIRPFGGAVDPVKVRVAQTTVLQPASGSLVWCSAGDPKEQQLVSLLDQEQRLFESSLFVPPALLPAGPCRVMITNPTSRPHILYQGQTIGSAIPVYEFQPPSA